MGTTCVLCGPASLSASQVVTRVGHDRKTHIHESVTYAKISSVRTYRAVHELVASTCLPFFLGQIKWSRRDSCDVDSEVIVSADSTTKLAS